MRADITGRVRSVPTPAGRTTLTRNRSLDGIRAFAILAVIASHLELPHLLGGGVGVNVFFVLSGFLITTLLLAERDAAGRISLRNFYARRALRLLPALFLMVACVSAYTLVVLAASERHKMLGPVPYVLFYVGNWRRALLGVDALSWFGHTWSLSIEEQFYILWPLALIVAAKWRGRRAVLAVALAGSGLSLLLRILLWHGPVAADRIYNGTDTEADQLLIGCALAIAVNLWPDAVRRVCRLGLWPGLAVLAFAVVDIEHLALRYTVGWTLFALSGAMLVGHVATEPGGRVGRLLAWRPLAFTGMISYGLYLWHFPIVLASKGHLHSVWLLSAFVLVATYATAYASWRVVEQPALRLKSRFAPAAARARAQEAPAHVPVAAPQQLATGAQAV
jgi:peptidoglycan/LPS O-acetylase OafA/YrhL